MTPEERKKIPLYSGIFKYFPDAMRELAKVSYAGSKQHHPDKPMHWDRDKSKDHLDCAMRHMTEEEVLDDDGLMHLAKALWRVAAQLQLECEAREKNKN